MLTEHPTEDPVGNATELRASFLLKSLETCSCNRHSRVSHVSRARRDRMSALLVRSVLDRMGEIGPKLIPKLLPK